MLNTISAFANLAPAQLIVCVGAVFMASLVRGFSGFALSALIMASIVIIIPPIQLIPICFLLEGTASLIMLKGGIKDADMRIAWGLAITAAIGAPIGLYATTTLPIETSKLIALILLISLALLQLFKIRIAFLATKTGLYLSGFVAGIITGLASIGGMVVALYILSQDRPARQMRGSLVIYLFLGMFSSLIYLIAYEILTLTALKRALVFAPFVISGVLIGSAFFKTSLESFYKKFCLILLITLASLSLARLMLTG